MISEVIAGGSGIVTLLNGAHSLWGRLSGREKKQLIDALRAIYFVPSNVRLLLADRAVGKEISTDRIDRGSLRFVGAEENIGWALERILRQLDESANFGLRNGRLLDEIRWGTIDLRRQLLEAFEDRFDIAPDEARVLLAQVDDLNEKIEALEDRLRANG